VGLGWGVVWWGGRVFFVFERGGAWGGYLCFRAVGVGGGVAVGGVGQFMVARVWGVLDVLWGVGDAGVGVGVGL